MSVGFKTIYSISFMKIVFFLFIFFVSLATDVSILLIFYIASYFFHFLSFLHFQLHWFIWLWFPSCFGFTFLFLWSWVGFRLLTWNFSSVVLYIYIWYILVMNFSVSTILAVFYKVWYVLFHSFMYIVHWFVLLSWIVYTYIRIISRSRHVLSNILLPVLAYLSH